MNKKVYVLCDSRLHFKEIVKGFKDEDLNLVHLEDVGEITEAKSEVWDCRSDSVNLMQKEIELDLTCMVM